MSLAWLEAGTVSLFLTIVLAACVLGALGAGIRRGVRPLQRKTIVRHAAHRASRLGRQRARLRHQRPTRWWYRRRTPRLRAVA
jgi:hypothetical protein